MSDQLMGRIMSFNSARAAVLAMMSEDQITAAIGHGWRWRTDLYNWETEHAFVSPARALWLLSQGMSDYETHKVLPGDWETSMEEWRLRNV